jgi:hypothetical protein
MHRSTCVGSCPIIRRDDRDITMQCTGAVKPVVFKWTITCRGPVIDDVSRMKEVE